MISRIPLLAPLFGERSDDLGMGKPPALVRVAPRAPIIETYFTLSAGMGPIQICNPHPEYTVPKENFISELRLWDAMANFSEAILVSQYTTQEIFYLDTVGRAHTYNWHLEEEGTPDIPFTVSLRGLKQIGFVKTRPKYLDPDIRPYRLYASSNLKVCFPDRYGAALEDTPDVFEICPPIEMYSALCETDADWVYSVGGEYKFCKRG